VCGRSTVVRWPRRFLEVGEPTGADRILGRAGVGGDDEAPRGLLHRQLVGQPLHLDRLLDALILLRRQAQRLPVAAGPEAASHIGTGMSGRS